jgi:hypothetical protein
MKKFYTSFPDHDILATLPGASRNILVDYYLRRRVPRS